MIDFGIGTLHICDNVVQFHFSQNWAGPLDVVKTANSDRPSAQSSLTPRMESPSPQKSSLSRVAVAQTVRDEFLKFPLLHTETEKIVDFVPGFKTYRLVSSIDMPLDATGLSTIPVEVHDVTVQGMPVLNKHSRLLTATFSNLSPRQQSASNIIGSNYTPSAAGVMIDPVKSQVVIYDAVLQGREMEWTLADRTSSSSEVVGSTDRSVADFDRQRYNALKETAITDNDVVAMDNTTETRIRDRMSMSLAHFPSRGSDLPRSMDEFSIIESAFGVVKNRFKRSLKKNILDYVLLSDAERDRLRINRVPENHLADRWGWGLAPGSRRIVETPDDWHLSYQIAQREIHERLFITSKPFLRSQESWAELADLCLLDLPGKDMSSWVPSSVEMFKTNQLKHMETVKVKVIEGWYPNVKSLFRDAVQSNELRAFRTPLERYFDAVAVMIGSQLRKLVTKSIESLLDTFRAFALGPACADGKEHAMFVTKPIFMIYPTSDESSISFSSALDDMIKCVRALFDGMTTCFSAIPRLEADGPFSPGDLETTRPQTIRTVDPEEGLIVTAENEILDILSRYREVRIFLVRDTSIRPCASLIDSIRTPYAAIDCGR